MYSIYHSGLQYVSTDPCSYPGLHSFIPTTFTYKYFRFQNIREIIQLTIDLFQYLQDQNTSYPTPNRHFISKYVFTQTHKQAKYEGLFQEIKIIECTSGDFRQVSWYTCCIATCSKIWRGLLYSNSDTNKKSSSIPMPLEMRLTQLLY